MNDVATYPRDNTASHCRDVNQPYCSEFGLENPFLMTPLYMIQADVCWS